MTHVLSLGAINKHTGEYVYPKISNKKDEYICPECNKDLICVQGEIRVHHFRHKIDNVNPCHHYSNPTETQIHKDAKILLKTLLERKIQILLIRNCCFCKKNEEFEIPEISESSTIEIEYRFTYNGLKIADVAYTDNDDIVCIFEIYNTHKTCSENRPEPWFEINAETLIKTANDNSLTSLLIPCIRSEKCDDCIEKIKNKLIENIRKINFIRFNDLELKLKKAEQDCSDDYWGKSDYNIKNYKIQIDNIKNEVEIELLKQNIVYINKNNEKFIIEKKINNQTIKLISISLVKIGKYGFCKINIIDLYNWYFNIRKNIIDNEIYHNELMTKLIFFVDLQDTEKTNNILQLLKFNKFDEPKNIEIDFVKNGIKFDKDLQGYIIFNHKTKFKIKYSFNEKLLLNGKWIKNINYFEIIKWFNILPNKIDEIINQQKLENKKIVKKINDNKYIKEKFNNIKNNNKLNSQEKLNEFIDFLIPYYEINIYCNNELNKNIFDECYYSKYYRAINSLKLNGYNFNIRENDGNEIWGGWGGNMYINNGCYKPILYKFIKYYGLINPMTIIKDLQGIIYNKI
jgi:hypothetical protein